MSIAVTFNGSSYSIPQYNDTGWAQGSGNLTLYLVALSSALSGWNSDITIIPAGSGIILTDAVNGHTYRVLMYNGVVSTQLVT